MEVVTVKLGADNRMTLPKRARDALALRPGDRALVVVADGDVHILRQPEDWADGMYGLGKEMWESLGGGERFLKQERSSWSR